MLDVAPLEVLRRQRPLIHCVSNLVTANDCANLALAVGASPMMACAPQEMAEITAAASATVLNTGTPDEERFEVCRLCGCEAVRLGHPVVLDPVGVGASPWRLRRTQELLHLWTPSILRVNLGEAQALLAMNSRGQGVDSPGPASQRERLYAAVALARSRRTVVLLSGPEDIVTDGASTWVLWGGSDQMSRITGTGCMLSVLCGAFAAVAGAREAALLASAFWKVCAAQAEERTQGRGPGSFHTALLDAAGTLTPADLAAGTQIQEISHRSEPQ